MTRTLVFDPDGTVRTIYHDVTAEHVLSALGPLHVTRASFVEFDESAQEWVARTPSGRVLSRGKSRAAVVAEEARTLEAEL